MSATMYAWKILNTDKGEKNGHLTPPKASPPPVYEANSAVNAFDVTAAFSDLSLQNSSTPTVDQCIAHLKLLEAFHQLREDVALHDGLFGIKDSFASGDEPQHREFLTQIREKRWEVYVTKAAKRFESWWEKAIEPNAQPFQQSDVMSTTQYLQWGTALSIGQGQVPPLDVIMVWHAYQLNPRNFLEDCLRLGKMSLWRAGLPWTAIDACIDSESFDFKASHEAVENFESVTGLAWDGWEPLDEAQIKCPNCNRIHSVPWTKWCHKSHWQKTSYSACFNGEINASGFADKAFCLVSPCGTWIDHELLRLHKFRKDMQALRFHDVPMPGTLLDTQGSAKLSEAGDSLERHQTFFPNRLILGADNNKPSKLYTKLEDITAVHETSTNTISDVRSAIEDALRDRDYVKKVKSRSSKKSLHPQEKISIRKMMSCYWDNSSPFSLDLVGAVIRQGTFIEKMHSLDWLHSPTVTSTMNRLLVRYDRYFCILSAHPSHTAVPTLDIDLAWHTHQLNPLSYHAYSLQKTSRFIDHDDKIEETKLSEAFKWTSKTYQTVFNEVYSECKCWYCEAVRESHTSPLQRAFTSTKTINNQLSILHAPSDPHSAPHISAHNAIKAITTKDHTIREAVAQAKLTRNYGKAARRAKKQGREPPPRDEYMYAYSYGYCMYMPYYAPYMGDPCVTGGMYAADPSSMNLQPGAVGNCCQGACSGGVAAGGCAGGTGGGCDGDGGDDGGGACGGCGGCGG